MKWAQDRQIESLKEFGCNTDSYDPYQNGNIPKFKVTPSMGFWFYVQIKIEYPVQGSIMIEIMEIPKKAENDDSVGAFYEKYNTAAAKSYENI